MKLYFETLSSNFKATGTLVDDICNRGPVVQKVVRDYMIREGAHNIRFLTSSITFSAKTTDAIYVKNAFPKALDSLLKPDTRQCDHDGCFSTNSQNGDAECYDDEYTEYFGAYTPLCNPKRNNPKLCGKCVYNTMTLKDSIYYKEQETKEINNG